jgi:hypothetical protein
MGSEIGCIIKTGGSRTPLYYGEIKNLKSHWGVLCYPKNRPSQNELKLGSF